VDQEAGGEERIQCQAKRRVRHAEERRAWASEEDRAPAVFEAADLGPGEESRKHLVVAVPRRRRRGSPAEERKPDQGF